jgi:Hypoxia induced protein conserved region
MRLALGCCNVPLRCYVNGMSDFMSHYLVPIAIGAVAVVLVLGLINMMRGGSPNTSQKLMRMRVLLQFVAIVVIMATIWMMGR